MEQQLVGVADVLDIEQLYLRVVFGVEILIHVLQHVLNTYLLAIADAPYGVELQALDDGRLEDEYGGGSRTTDEVDTLRVQVGDGLGEHAVVPRVEQTDAVGANQCGAILLAGVEDVFLQGGAGGGLLAKTSGDDDESLHAFLRGKHFHRVGTELGGYHHHGQVGRGYLLHVVEHFHALHLVFLGVDDAQHAFVAAIQQVAHDGSSWLVGVVRTAHHYNTLRSQ